MSDQTTDRNSNSNSIFTPEEIQVADSARERIRHLEELLTSKGYDLLLNSIEEFEETCIAAICERPPETVAQFFIREQAIGGLRYLKNIKKVVPAEISKLVHDLAEFDSVIQAQLQNQERENEKATGIPSGPVELASDASSSNLETI